MIDTRARLGGYLLEFSVGDEPPPDDEWDLSQNSQLPREVEWLGAIPRIGHFGIAVNSVSERLPIYARMFGVDRWTGLRFHRAPSSMISSVYHGKEVDNGWMIAIADVSNFGLELLQSEREPTDYQDTISRIGEGMHHVLVRRDVPDNEWLALQHFMDSMGVGVVMGAKVRGGASEFAYFDTREALGYLLEVIVSHDVPPGPMDPSDRLVFDFSA